MSEENIENITSELQEVSTQSVVQLRELGYSIARLEASLLLMLPIRISYEDWCFLHKIVDCDIDE